MRLNRRTLAALALPVLLAGSLIALPGAAVADGNIDTIDVGDGPRSVVFSSDGAFAYVANLTDDTVSKINADTRAVVSTIAVGDEPVGAAITPSGAQLWITNFNGATISIIDLATFTVVDTISSGGTKPYGIVFDSAGEYAYVTNFVPGNVAKISTTTKTVVDTASYPDYYPEGIALNADESALYFGSTSQYNVVKLATATLDEITSVTVGTFPIGVKLSPDGTQLWVANNDSTAPSVSVISTATDTVLDTIPTSAYPIDVAWGWDGNVWVAHSALSAGPDKFDYASRTYLTSDLPISGEAFGIAARPGTKELYVTVSTQDQIQIIGVEADRLQGADRYATAVAISQAAFQTTAPVVYVATGTNYPDALAAGPAAAKLGGPVLLTQPGSLPAVTKAEIQRLDPLTIVVLGGTSAVSTAVANELATITTVRRIQGANRYETARNIVSDAFTTAPTVYLATGQNFPDALGGGNAGASAGSPVVLVNGQSGAVDAATLNLLDSLGTTDIKILGGTSVVSPAIQTQLSNLGFTVTRLSGADRYATSLAINVDAFTTSGYAILATATNFPDALAGSAIGGKVDAPLYVVPKDCVPAAVLADLDRLQASFVILLGGPAALTVAVQDLTSCS